MNIKHLVEQNTTELANDPVFAVRAYQKLEKCYTHIVRKLIRYNPCDRLSKDLCLIINPLNWQKYLREIKFNLVQSILCIYYRNMIKKMSLSLPD